MKLPFTGRVAKLFSEPGYGFIETPEGRQVYFHANSVLDENSTHSRSAPTSPLSRS
jgi:cold shock CspA family protein